jgi:hypothetical protein
MKKALPLFIALILLPLFVARTDAKLCFRETVCAAYEGASVIFVGTVLENTSVSIQFDPVYPEKVPLVGEVESTTFLLAEVFKGDIRGEIVIQDRAPNESPGRLFKEGERYLVFAKQDPKRGSYFIDSCPRIGLLANAGGDLAFLRGLPDSATKTRIYGNIIHATNYRDEVERNQIIRPMGGIRVFVSNREKSFEALTNEDGTYQVVGLPPGSYKVRAELPTNLSQKERQVNLPAGGCLLVDIITKSDGRVSGKVLDSQGRIVIGAEVNLLNADDPRRVSRTSLGVHSFTQSTNKDGYYEFVEVPPGRYYLGFDLEDEPKGEFPYPRTYYPGSPDRDQATVIVLGDGEHLTGYDIPLPPALPVKTIEGIFLWSDSRPVSPGNVTLRDRADTQTAGKIYAYATVDAQGHFTLRGFEGKECWVHGEARSTVPGSRETVEAIPIKVLVTDDMKSIKLIAPIPNNKPVPNGSQKL